MARRKKKAGERADELVGMKLTKVEKRTLVELGEDLELGPSALAARIVRDFLANPRPLVDSRLDEIKKQLVFGRTRPDTLPKFLLDEVEVFCEDDEFVKARKMVSSLEPLLLSQDEVAAVAAWLHAGESSSTSETSFEQLLAHMRAEMRARIDAVDGDKNASLMKS